MKQVRKRGVYPNRRKNIQVKIHYTFAAGQPAPEEELQDLLEEIRAAVMSSELVVEVRTRTGAGLPGSRLAYTHWVIDRIGQHATIIKAALLHNKLFQRELGDLLTLTQSGISLVVSGRKRIPKRGVFKLRELVREGKLALPEEIKALLEQD